MKNAMIVWNILGILMMLATARCAVAAGDPTAHTISVDKTAQALLERWEAATQNARTLTANATKIDQDGTITKATVRLMKPNYAVIAYSDVSSPATAPLSVASDGKALWRYPDHGKSEYLKQTTDPVGTGTIDWLGGLPLQAFFGVPSALKNGGVESSHLKYAGMRTWNSQTYSVLEHDFAEDGKRYTTWLYIGQDNLLHRQVGTYYIPKPDGTPRMFEVSLDNIQVNAPMQAAEFAYTPPSGAKLIVPKQLLPIGTVAPDFRVERPDGTTLRLSDYRGKVVVLDFWATWCLPCIRGMTETNAVAAQFSKEGVVVLTINVWDSKPNMLVWLPAHPQYNDLTFAIDTAPQGQDVASLLYQVSGIPTQYVIDRNGKIRATIFGYSGPSAELNNAVSAAVKER